MPIKKGSRTKKKVKGGAGGLRVIIPSETQGITTGPNGIRWEVVGGSAGGYLKVFLQKGCSVIGQPGDMLYMKGAVSMPTIKADGFFGKLMSGEDILGNYYEGTSETDEGIVAFGQVFPGGVVGIELEAGKAVKMSKGSLIAYTPNVQIGFKANVKGLFSIGQDEGFLLPTATCKEGTGMIWLSTFGTMEEHVLGENETLTIDIPNQVNFGTPTWPKYISSLTRPQMGTRLLLSVVQPYVSHNETTQGPTTSFCSSWK